jgi:hypothetical protein
VTRRSTRPWRLTVLSLLWLGVLMGLLKCGPRLLPTVVARQLTVEGYSSLAQLVTMGLGLGLSYRLLDAPRRDLGLEGVSRGRSVLFAVLLARGRNRRPSSEGKPLYM